jgi:phage terminase small subunit
VTPKQRKFAEEYLVDQNATQAAIRAGYSKKTACAQGSRLLRNVKVAAAIDAKTEKHLAKVEVTAERIMQELAAVAFSSIADFIKIDNEGKPALDWDNIPEGATAAIQSIGGRNIITLHSKLDALKTLFTIGEAVERRRELEAAAAAGQMTDITPVSEMDVIEKARIIGMMMIEGLELAKKAKETKKLDVQCA